MNWNLKASELRVNDLAMLSPGRWFQVSEVSGEDCEGASITIIGLMVRFPGDGYSPTFECRMVCAAYPDDIIAVRRADEVLHD